MFEHKRLRASIAAACAVLAPFALADVADPTRPPLESAGAVRPAMDPEAVTLTLTMTRVSAERREAVINGRLVEEGDAIGATRVMAIEHGRVRVRRDGREWLLVLHAADVKRRSTEG